MARSAHRWRRALASSRMRTCWPPIGLRERQERRRQMKITKVEPLLLDRFCYVRIETDQGITGLGESGAWGQLEATAASISKYAEYLIGKDPRPIEHHWNVMLRANHFTGGAINGAVSAIDIALWDIKGKSHGVPVYELLGGKMRDKARLYAHAKGRTRETLIEEAVRL